MSLSDAVLGLKAYKEVDERMEQLWRNIDAAIVSPRMDAKAKSLPRIQVSGDILELDGKADHSIGSLLSDLEKMFTLLATKLPTDLLRSLCAFMMSDVIPRLIQNWLGPAVPSSLSDMKDFETMIEEAGQLCSALEENGYTGFEELQEWVNNAPLIWLGKCREMALSTIRSRLADGIGKSKQVEKVEKQIVSLAEGKELATSGAGATAETNEWGDDWGDAWGEDDDGQTQDDSKSGDTKANGAEAEAEDDGTDAWGWDDDDTDKAAADDDDIGADAWGWGDEDATQEPSAPPSPKKPRKPQANKSQEQTRELVLKETYNISSMPEPVLELIFAILEDGARLTKGGEEYGHVASTAPGLFGLPTYALALFRAISPHYYALDGGGNM